MNSTHTWCQRMCPQKRRCSPVARENSDLLLNHANEPVSSEPCFRGILLWCCVLRFSCPFRLSYSFVLVVIFSWKISPSGTRNHNSTLTPTIPNSRDAPAWTRCASVGRDTLPNPPRRRTTLQHGRGLPPPHLLSGKRATAYWSLGRCAPDTRGSIRLRVLFIWVKNPSRIDLSKCFSLLEHVYESLSSAASSRRIWFRDSRVFPPGNRRLPRAVRSPGRIPTWGCLFLKIAV
jgi:hypothetical protein